MTILVCFGGTPIFGTPHIYIHIRFVFFVFENLFLDFISLFEGKKWFSRLAGASADALHLLKISVGIARDEALGISLFFQGIFCGSSMKTGGFTIGDPLKFPLSLVLFCFEMMWKLETAKKIQNLRTRKARWVKRKGLPKKGGRVLGHIVRNMAWWIFRPFSVPYHPWLTGIFTLHEWVDFYGINVGKYGWYGSGKMQLYVGKKSSSSRCLQPS